MTGPSSMVVCALLALGAVPVARAQEPNTSTRAVAVVTGKVDRIDRFSRVVTVRTPEGLLHSVYAGKELKAFDQLQTGDTVTVRVNESVVVAVRPGAKLTAVEDSTVAAKAGAGAADADVMQQLKATVRVDRIDMPTQVITYKTADNRNVMRQVTDRHLLEGLKAGDIIEITYTRERAIEIRKN
jgi:hydroxyethylthiazole kinase-like sugar kinase family protein